MPLIPSNFAANSLTGSVRVSGGYANVILTVSKYAFEDRTKTFVLKLRRDSAQGPVIAQSNTVTLTDFSEIVSLTANTSTVAEGNLVSLSLVTANVVNGANVFFSVLPVAGNVTSSDFLGANAGVVTINNNQGTIVLYANADYSLTDEAGEAFKVQLRTVNTSGNIVFASSNIAITDFFKRVNVFGFVESSRSIVEGTSVTFTISAHNIATGTLLYYYTTGNAGISGSNTGSVVMNSVSNTITITSAAAVPANESRSFSLVLSESSLGSPIATSNAITVVDSALAYLNATGGTVSSIDGFRIHTFTSSNTFSATNFAGAAFNTANILVIAGGGGGANPPYGNGQGGGGGGGGGFVSQTDVSLTGTLTITIGGGGSAGSPGGNGSNSLITGSGNFANVLSVGGGGGGGVTPGRPGGSGGGASNYPLSNGGGGGAGWGFPGPAQQGYPGGYNYGNPEGAGGGGAGGYGGNVDTRVGGPGAISTITGSSVAYSGGGQGARPGSSSPSGPAAPGGGGAGAADSFAATAGTVNTGGGGGGGQVTSTRPGASGGSGVVIIRYPWRPAAFFTSVTPNVGGVYEGANVFFVVNTTFANAVSLFYDTVGNVTSSNFVGGNTGSFTITSNATVISLQTIANIPENESRNFALRIREDSVTGNIVLVSSNVGIFDDNQNIYINATGGNVFTVGGFRTHIFTSSNNFAVTDAGKIGGTVEYMIVAGGGGGQTGGQNDGGGGGGAGGLLSGTSTVVANTYVVTVGSGGGTATSGSNSSVLSLIAVGGGAGGATNLNTTGPIGNGGSGGGSSFNYFGTAPGEFYGGGAGIAGQGNPGGRTPYRNPSYGWGGGGGGAGGAGGGNLSPSQSTAVVGGVGISSPLSPSIPGFFGTPGPASGRWFAGGGGTGGANFPSNSSSPFGAAGGAGGGGKGGDGQGPGGPGQVGMSGNVNTGGGGGAGGGANPTIGTGGSGGSGIIIIRYPFVVTPIYTSVTTANTLINEGANVTFTITTQNANANILYYTTVGNVLSSDFVGGNTGSFTVTGDSTTLTLRTNSNIPTGEERTFQLQVRRDSTTGPLKLTSNTIYIYDSATSIYINATGGNVFTSGGFRTHIFTASNNFVVTSAGVLGGNVEYLVVGGGGSGGTGYYGGGGGAGGFVENTSLLTSGTYTITVGAGGVGTTIQTNRGGNGSNSTISSSSPTFVTITALGGGGGGSRNNDVTGENTSASGAAGGSGGGVGFSYPGTSTPQSAKGGDALQPSHPSGGFGNKGGGQASPALGDRRDGQGGGGAGAAASDNQNNDNGGVGRQSSITGTAVYYAGGGGGTYTTGGPPGSGGLGGGAPGGSTAAPTPAANVNTGGGGGGGFDLNTQGGNGGSGIVIIRYPFA